MTGTDASTARANLPANYPLAKLLYPDLDGELASTRKILERFPDGRGDWLPHEKSMTLGRLATHVADLPNRGTTILETDGMDIATRQIPPSLTTAAELLGSFDSAATRLRARVAEVDLPALQEKWAIRRGDQVLLSLPKLVLMRTMLINHLIHHRAQLGVYYRLLGIPVPGMYGPTADEPI